MLSTERPSPRRSRRWLFGRAGALGLALIAAGLLGGCQDGAPPCPAAPTPQPVPPTPLPPPVLASSSPSPSASPGPTSARAEAIARALAAARFEPGELPAGFSVNPPSQSNLE